MTCEQLISLGLSSEQALKVSEALDGEFVAKGRFNEINVELKEARAELERKDEEHNANITKLKLDIALKAALAGARAKNPETVKPLLRGFLENAELDGDNIRGLDLELKKLAEADDTGFLFEADTKQESMTGFRGIRPGEGSGNKAENSAPKTLADAVKGQLTIDN